MSIWALIPVKPVDEGKSRLAEVLSTGKRIQLNLQLFRRTFAIVCNVFPPGHVIVVSRDATVLGIAAAAGAKALAEHGYSLNQALCQAVNFVSQADGLFAMSAKPPHHIADFPHPPSGIVTVSADLPHLEPEDLHDLLAEPYGVTIAPDRLGQGTNALLTAPMGCIPFRFGENSFALHSAEALRAGITPRIVARPGLAFDLDSPEDLRDCQGFEF